jgi:hypothetical protein
MQTVVLVIWVVVVVVAAAAAAAANNKNKLYKHTRKVICFKIFRDFFFSLKGEFQRKFA